MSAVARLTGVFFEPTNTFEDIGRRPSWLLPLALTIVASLAFYYFYGQHVGWERFLRHQMETSQRMQQQMAQMTPDQRERTQAMQVKFMGVGYYGGTIVMTPVIYLISALILWGIASAMGAGLRFKQVFAIVCFAGLPLIIKQLLAIVVMFLKNPDDFNLTNPLAFNPAAFMDPLNTSKFLYTIATAVDVFTIWIILLTALGISAVAGKRLSFGGALVAVLVPWVIMVLFGASMASMFA